MMESSEKIPLCKLSVQNRKNIIKKLKTKKLNNLKNGTLLIEICNKNQTDKILKWKRFDNIKIKTCPQFPEYM